MHVIPAVNETVFSEVKRKLEIIADFSDWAHVDVADGVFTENATWRNPDELREFLDAEPSLCVSLGIEAHFMMQNPEEELRAWLAAGVERAIIHIEAARDIPFLKQECGKRGVEFVLGVGYAYDIKAVLRCIKENSIANVLFLAVQPGPAGQKFHAEVLPSIEKIKKAFPAVTVEVDGGINAETGRLCKKAGADILVSGSYIFSSSEPERQFQTLRNILTS